MLPFPILNQYGNEIPKIGAIKKYFSTFYGIVILSVTGDLYVIGQNNLGQLGLPQSVTYQMTWTLSATNVSDFWCSDNAVMLIRLNDGTFKYTGRKYWTGSAVTSYGFVDCTSFLGILGTTYKSINLSTYTLLIIDNNDILYVCGYNSTGQLGFGNTNAVSSLIQLTTSVNKVSTTLNGDATAVLKLDGTLWTCGNNLSYQLGYSSPNPQPLLTQVSTSGVIDVQMGYDSMYVLRSDGIYNCGRQFSGQLGNAQSNNNNKTFSKVTISAGTPTEIYYGRYTCLAKIGTSYYQTGQNISGTGNNNSSFTLIPNSYITDLNPTNLQVGYYKLYALVGDYFYGSGIYNALNYENLLPYYTSNVIGLQKLTTTL